MSLINSIVGMYRIEIFSASITDALSSISQAGIHIFDISYVDELTITGKIFVYAYKRLSVLLEKRGDAVKIIDKEGLYWSVSSLKRRPILLAGLIVFLALAFYLPTRVLFIRVEGNEYIPAKAIIEKAENCGIKFGTSRRQVRSEKVKNALLGAIPELKWAGINTYGCVAIISVQERDVSQQKTNQTGIASIVAKSDGVITQMTVTRGTALCREGYAVKRGQVLVSGYTDCGISIKAEVAEGEIFAKTRHNLTVVTPVNHQQSTNLTPFEKRYSLKIGKKLINFSKCSGIYSATCVKMYKENYLLLPGGFRLPIALVTEQLYCRDLEEKTVSDEDAFSWLEDYSKSYLNDTMIAGKILCSDFTGDITIDQYTLKGNFACMELIGQLRYEEIIDGNGKRN